MLQNLKIQSDNSVELAKFSQTYSSRETAFQAISELENRFKSRLVLNNDLTRSLVSFQANKAEPVHRWFKYREGFSRSLIEYCFDKLAFKSTGVFCDPFAGTGTSAVVASEIGLKSYAVELLPVGAFFIDSISRLKSTPLNTLAGWAKSIIDQHEWKNSAPDHNINYIKITNGAYPEETEKKFSQYRAWVNTLNEPFKTFADFVLFSILEDISYTRKDGQYLRWDRRAPRLTNETEFDKGKIYSFEEALESKCKHIIDDIENHDFAENLFEASKKPLSYPDINLLSGSVFDVIKNIPDDSIDYVITSPPYCNRYDYTRTYALELAYLGVDEVKIRELRQALLTCTVENKPKQFAGRVPLNHVQDAETAFRKSDALQASIQFLEAEKEAGHLNNKGIVTMVSGYFWELGLHLRQMAAKMRSGGYYVMVNDNVRYSGLEIPVDCILSELAENVGFHCEKIWVLPKGKGNSSQQMALHGRKELRKCVYIWRKN